MFLGIEMAFISMAKAFCVLGHARTQSIKTVYLASCREFCKKYQLQLRFGNATKSSEDGCSCRAKRLDDHQYRKRLSRKLRKHCSRILRVVLFSIRIRTHFLFTGFVNIPVLASQ